MARQTNTFLRRRVPSCFRVYGAGEIRYIKVMDFEKLDNVLSKSPKPATVYVLGGNDRGKTTLCTALFQSLAAGFNVAYIDCDPDQSVIGPPATAGLKVHYNSGKNKTFLRFLGTTNPAAHMHRTRAV